MTLEILLLILAVFGGIDLASRGFLFAVHLFPPMLTAQSRLVRFAAESVNISVFRRRAASARVEEVLNQVVFSLQDYLPKGWVRRARIKWVRRDAPALLREGVMLLRVRPKDNIDNNVINILWLYFRDSLFPNCRDLLPADLLSGAALTLARSGLEVTHPYLLEEFDKTFVQFASGGDRRILKYFADFSRLNDYGLFMGPWLREINETATRARYNIDREQVGECAANICSHMLGFQPLLRLNKPDEDWVFKGDFNSYGFLLVSRPPEIRPDIGAYVRRAEAEVRRGIKRLYIIGRRDERDFIFAVTKELLRIRELKGLEIFSLFRDYRGDPAGVGALLGADELVAKLKLPNILAPALEVKEDLDDPIDLTFGVDQSHDQLDVATQTDLADITEDLIVRLSDYEGAWISLAEFGNELRREIPGFTPQRYGGRNLFSVLSRLKFLEFDERGAGPAKAVYVRITLGGAHNGGGASLKVAAGDSGIEAALKAILQEHTGEGSWMFLGQLGHLLKVKLGEFNYLKSGASSFHEYIERIPLIEMEERGEGHSKTYVRLRRPTLDS